MASHPPSHCCTVGVKHEGEPTGKKTTIGNNIEAYIAEPTGKTVHKDTAIFIAPDVIGIWQNSQLIADQFAANGYYTLIPDLFDGDALSLNRPKDFDFQAWRGRHPAEKVDKYIEAAITDLKGKGFKKIGAVGYCFGAKSVVRFMAKGKGVDVGYVAHPSFVDEEELAAITGPLSIAAAETDGIFPAEKRHKSEIILKDSKVPYQINLYSGVEHGFTVRGDMSNKVAKFGKEQAFIQAVQWFDAWLVDA